MQGAEGMVVQQDVLEVERWASRWLGTAWVVAPMGEEAAEHHLVMQMVAASSKPSPEGLAALSAFRRVAPDGDLELLDETIEILTASQPAPSWSASPPFEAVGAWRAVDVWDSERVLFVEYASTDPAATGHTLVAQVVEAGTTMVSKVTVLQAGAAVSWESMHDAEAPPMPLAALPVAEVLADLAGCLRMTDMMWPRHDDEDFIELRALAWARSREFLPEWPDFEPLTDTERDDLAAAFVAEWPGVAAADGDVVRSLVEVFLDFGDGYLHDRPLGWSPRTVAMFLADWLPRKVVLDDTQRAALPDLLRSWIRFGLGRREVAEQWIVPVVEAVDEWLPDLDKALDDGPAKQIVAELEARGTDLADEVAVAAVISELNAGRLARGLKDERAAR